jgi:hypothetical protein
MLRAGNCIGRYIERAIYRSPSGIQSVAAGIRSRWVCMRTPVAMFEFALQGVKQ